MLVFRTFSALFKLFLVTRGDAFRCASRLPLAFILRAFGAVRLSYSAPGAIGFIWRAFGAIRFYIARLWRCHVSYSAPGAQFPLFCKANGNRIEHDSDVVNLFCRQLRSPRIVCSFARNDSEFRKCPKNSPDVSLHRSDEQNFSEFVDRVRQLEKAFCVTFEV